MPCTPKQLFDFIQGASISKDSNYNIWERLGNSGEAEFIQFLRSGNKGETGLSTYESWLKENTGKSFDDFIESLRGNTGKSIYEAWCELDGNSGKTLTDFFEFIRGETGNTGDTGAQGATGDKGEKGDNGVFPTDVIYDVIYLYDTEDPKPVRAITITNGVINTISNPVTELIITTPPTKTDYTDTELFDSTGMVVTAKYGDNTTKDVTSLVNYEKYVVTGENKHQIYYTESNITLVTNVDIITRTLEDALIDFYYTKDETSGVYTITGWKETYNGVPSTECILPNNDNILI